MRNAATSPKGWLSFIRILARDSKLKIVVGRNVGPATNGKVMWLPALPAELTPDDLVLFEGNAFHEVGHIQRSNISYFQAFCKEHGSFAGFLLNALDDVFMEGRQAAWKWMAGDRLLRSTMVLIKRDQFRDGSAGLGEAVACYCLAYLTGKRWPSVNVATVRIEGNLRKHLAQHADKVIPELRNLLDAEFPAVNSTESGGELALKIIKLLQSLAEQEQPQTGSPSEDSQDDGDAEGSSASDSSESESESEDEGEDSNSKPDADSQESDDGEGKADADSKPDGDDDEQDGGAADDEAGSKDQDESDADTGNAGSNGEKEDKSSEGESKQDQGGQGQSETSAEQEPGKSLQEMIQEMLKEDLGDQEVFDKGSALQELADEIASGKNPAYIGQPLINGLVVDCSAGAGKAEGFADGMPIVEADREMAAAIAQITGRKANVMGNRLRALLANREETESFAARSGRLSEKDLYRFANNDLNIFSKEEDRIEDTAAVSMTADLSGSTGIKRDGSTVAEQIRIALSILEKVLQEIGTPREILGFAPNSGELNCLVKSFDDNHRVAMDRIAGMHRLVGGGSTPIGAAVLQAGSRLLSHPAQRKLLFVVTDGRPDNVDYATQMTKTIVNQGANVIYLVIGSESSCDWLRDADLKFAHAENAEGLIPAMVAKMAEFLK